MVERKKMLTNMHSALTELDRVLSKRKEVLGTNESELMRKICLLLTFLVYTVKNE